MLGREDEAVVQADAYIDALLATHGGTPVALPAPETAPAAQLRHAIELLGSSLPRYHPSFRFEESLAARLRAAAAAEPRVGDGGRPAGVPHLPLVVPLAGLPDAAGIDRRLLVGGAIASGVSIAGAAMLVRAAQRRTRPRPRLEWLS
jgi:hypothetical protein